MAKICSAHLEPSLWRRIILNEGDKVVMSKLILSVVSVETSRDGAPIYFARASCCFQRISARGQHCYISQRLFSSGFIFMADEIEIVIGRVSHPGLTSLLSRPDRFV